MKPNSFYALDLEAGAHPSSGFENERTFTNLTTDNVFKNFRCFFFFAFLCI